MEEPEILSFKLNLVLAATVSVEGSRGIQDWVKPSVESGIKWKGIPSEAQIKDAISYIMQNVLEPTLSDIASTVLARERELKQEMH